MFTKELKGRESRNKNFSVERQGSPKLNMILFKRERSLELLGAPRMNACRALQEESGGEQLRHF